MKVRNHRLLNADGTVVPFHATPNKSGKLTGDAPKYIVIHFTANGSARGALAWLSDRAAQASAHLVIGHDGDVAQMGKFNEKLWHAGRSRWAGLVGLNAHSVGIEIVNWGGLSGGWGGWKSWTGVAVPDARVIEAAHPQSPGRVQGWEIYDAAQVEAAAAAVGAIAAAYGLGPAAVIGHEDISPGRKTDPGPAWDMARFRARVFGRAEDAPETDVMVVASASGLNMREGPGVGHRKLETLPDGAEVEVVERDGRWALVAKLENGVPDATGWVHTNWLRAA